jgi:hypothetical protein
MVDPLGSRNVEYGMDFEQHNTKKSSIGPEKRIIGQSFN